MFMIMKRVMLGMMVLALCLCCAACRQKTPTPEAVTFRAMITDISNGSMLVTPEEGSEERKSSDAFRVAIEHMPASPEPRIGDTVEITYNGNILETYPAGLDGVTKIIIVEQAALPEEAVVDATDGPEETQKASENVAIEIDHDAPAPEVTGPYGTISVDVPDHWSWESYPVDSEGLTYGQYGLILKPRDAIGGQLELIYSDNFAVCGTGLEEQKITLAGVPALQGTYNEEAHWDFIIYQGEKENIVAQAILCASWSDDMWDEALQILDTVRLDPSRVNGGIWQYSPECENDEIAVVMDVHHVGSDGVTVRFNRYDQEDRGEMFYGEAFYLEKQTKDGWERVPVIIEEDWGFTEEGYPIPQGSVTEMETNWAWLYGELEPGTYRICKSVWKDGEHYDLAAQFLLT